MTDAQEAVKKYLLQARELTLSSDIKNGLGTLDKSDLIKVAQMLQAEEHLRMQLADVTTELVN